MTFAENLRKIRLEHGMTQIDLSEKCGINPKTLSSYETGRTEPNLGEIRKLCDVFNCSIATLTGTKEREIGNISVEDILIKLQTLDDKTLKNIMFSIETIIESRDEIKHILEEKAMLEERLKKIQNKINMKKEGEL